MGNPLLAGRDLTWTDIYETRPVVLVSESLARELWHDPARRSGSKSARIQGGMAGGRWRGGERARRWRRSEGEYDGVLAHDDQGILGQPLMAQRSQAFAIRSSRTGSAGFLNEVRRAVWSVNPDLPIAGVRTVQEIYDRSLAARRSPW